MNSFDTIFDLAVALCNARILKFSDPAETGSWGVISCREALGAFDARSEAWVRRDGVPARFTREEAELRARRMTGSSYDDTGYCALEIPERPRLITAGRDHRAAGGPILFACVDWSNGPGNEIATGSAFEAAVAFSDLAGERGSYSALAQLLEEN